jgi:hypothetical protein
MAVFKGQFYIGLRNTISSGQVYRSSNGLDWTAVITDGLGIPANTRPYGLVVYDDRLYLVFSNMSGAQVWWTYNGKDWWQCVSGGWDDGNNIFADYFNKAGIVFKDSLYVGTQNSANGGEIWQRLQELFLPLMRRD